MQNADRWFICRIGFVETTRAVGLAAGPDAVGTVREEWPSFGVVEIDQTLTEQASRLALDNDLRSLDALHLAAALLLASDGLVFATWDRRLHTAARAHRLNVLPQSMP
jgi:predicted nucleic acid-binding protein